MGLRETGIMSIFHGYDVISFHRGDAGLRLSLHINPSVNMESQVSIQPDNQSSAAEKLILQQLINN
jgi:hypothetical protein